MKNVKNLINDYDKTYTFEQQILKRDQLKKNIKSIIISINTFSQQILRRDKLKKIINVFNVNYDRF